MYDVAPGIESFDEYVGSTDEYFLCPVTWSIIDDVPSCVPFMLRCY